LLPIQVEIAEREVKIKPSRGSVAINSIVPQFYPMNTRPNLIRELICLLAIVLGGATASAQAPASNKVTFDDHAKPVFIQRCSSCHSSNRKEGDLDVTNYTNLMIGGGSGEVIAPGSSDDSYLYKLITHEDSPEMPPSGTKIPEAEIKVIADWINQGALENAGSKPRKSKPKMEMLLGESALKRPEVTPMPLRMPIQPVIRPDRPSTNAIATSPWAPLAALATPKQILLYHTQALELVGVLPMPEGVAHSLKFSRNGSLLVAGGGRDGMSGQAVIWDVKFGDRVATVGDELDTVLAVDIRSDHELIALGGPQKIVKIYSTLDGELRHAFSKHTDWVTALEFSPDGKYLASGDRNGGVHVWDPDAGSEIFNLKAHSKAITAISWRPDSKVVATASEDQSLRLWEINKGSQIKSWTAHAGGTTAAEFLRDGSIVTSGRDKVAKLWDQSGKMLKQFNGLNDITLAVSFCDESNRVLCSDWTGDVRVWDEEANLLGHLQANPPTLEERIAAAQKRLESAEQEYQPLAAKYEQSQAKLSQVTASLDATRKSLNQTQTRLDTATKELAAAKQKLESTRSQQIQWRSELEKTLLAKPLVAQAFAKANQASQALPDDPDLKNAAAQLHAKSDRLDSRIAELNALVSKSHEQTDTTKAEMDQLASTVEAERSDVQSMTTQIQQLESEVSEISTVVESDASARSVSENKISSARQEIQKWKDHLNFLHQLSDLEQQLTGVQTEIDERQTVVDAALEKLKAAQQLVDQAQQHKSYSEASAEEIRQQILDLRQVDQ
jgi:predicted  nucleic acid-binding Zn-ribbon protein